MIYQSDVIGTIKEHRPLFILIMVGLFLIELEIFAVAAMKSGHKAMVQISDPKGNVVLLTEGTRLSQIDKAAFERTEMLLLWNAGYPFRTGVTTGGQK